MVFLIMYHAPKFLKNKLKSLLNQRNVYKRKHNYIVEWINLQNLCLKNQRDQSYSMDILKRKISDLCPSNELLKGYHLEFYHTDHGIFFD